ncbi:MAG: polysaccharide biosynthesis tyrosine autokinase [Anaerolineae bacterium]|jgi:non-specific protein-tyrosine kinase
MELKQYWNLAWKWKWLLILGVVLAGVTSFVVSRNTTPVYQASTTLLVSPGSPQSSESYAALVASERLAQTYAQLLRSGPILEQTYERLGLPLPRDVITGKQAGAFSVSAESVRDTQLINLQVEGTDPGLITEAANTLVQVFIEWKKGVQQSRYGESKTSLAAEMDQVQASIRETENTIQALQAEGEGADQNELARLQDQLTQYRNNYSALLRSYSEISLAEANSGDTITVVSRAVRPMAPIRPRVMMNTLLAAVVGGMLAVGVAFLAEYLDDTVKAPEDLQLANLNTIAAIQQMSLDGRGDTAALLTVSDPRSLVSEAYRTLRTNLQFSSPDEPLRSLVVTSAVATEGKTTTSANLAVVMAQAGKRVVLVDGDLRRPSIHKLFGVSNRTGLTTALVEDLDGFNEHLQKTEIENLRVLTAGPIPPNPQELLGSQRMQDLLHRLREDADIVVVDTPPTLVVSDANVLATLTDGVLMVVNTSHTRRAAVQQAVEGLRKVDANLVGGVLNMVDTRGGRGYYYYYSYYSDYYGERGQDGGGGPVGWLRRLGRRPKG